MGRPLRCACCVSSQVQIIDAALRAGEDVRVLAGQFGLALGEVSWHKRQCLRLARATNTGRRRRRRRSA